MCPGGQNLRGFFVGVPVGLTGGRGRDPVRCEGCEESGHGNSSRPRRPPSRSVLPLLGFFVFRPPGRPPRPPLASRAVLA